jgi:hypothetical protein
LINTCHSLSSAFGLSQRVWHSWTIYHWMIGGISCWSSLGPGNIGAAIEARKTKIMKKRNQAKVSALTEWSPKVKAVYRGVWGRWALTRQTPTLFIIMGGLDIFHSWLFRSTGLKLY